ncbi:MAG: ABC transporter ATP-binding protein [Gammaproteobacteria bacterium]|nr:ABC transporter ATP-binding protein [Gammaproteobacteria bacterium]
MPPAIRIAGIDKRFSDEVHALNNVSFDIEQGAFFGLLGPNGAGKSTLINIIAGLTRADSGHVEVMGHDVVSNYRDARAALGVVPQELITDPFFTVRELLGLQAGYFGLPRGNREWVDELLTTLDLAGKANANMSSLSGGMKRRVLIAQALVHRPPVVVLDEPTAGVDVELRRVLWAFTERLHKQGHTIVLTTHYLEEAEALCGRIAILRRGRLSALEQKRTLLALHPYRFLDLELGVLQRVLPDAVEALVVERTETTISLRLHKKQDSIAAVLEALRANGIEFTDLSVREPGLEDVFLELTRDAGADKS